MLQSRSDYFKYTELEWDRMAGCHSAGTTFVEGSPDKLILTIAKLLVPLGDGPRRLEYLITRMEELRSESVASFARRLTR